MYIYIYIYTYICIYRGRPCITRLDLSCIVSNPKGPRLPLLLVLLTISRSSYSSMQGLPVDLSDHKPQ